MTADSSEPFPSRPEMPLALSSPNGATMAGPRGPVWLFSRSVDLTAFLGSALLALLLLAVGWGMGLLEEDTPEWTWVSFVLLVDVAHVYATGFRVYFVPGEFSRRRWLYGLAPLLGFMIGWAVFSENETYFWRGLAYLAVFHFVRQQYGWLALYRSKAGERGVTGRWIDTLAIYLATVYPLVHWHAHLPRSFWWFLPGDFAAAPEVFAQILQPIYWLALAAYVARSLWNGFRHRSWNPGKDIVLGTTAVCWYVGIVVINSDYAFTVTNVIIHGVPYLVLVYWYRFVRGEDEDKAHSGQDEKEREEKAERTGVTTPAWRRHLRTIIMFLGVVWILAFAEELLWDRSIWHERSWLFGSEWNIGRWRAVLVPLLVVPQLTHYILDGFIWRRRSNPEMKAITRDG